MWILIILKFIIVLKVVRYWEDKVNKIIKFWSISLKVNIVINKNLVRIKDLIKFLNVMIINKYDIFMVWSGMNVLIYLIVIVYNY